MLLAGEEWFLRTYWVLDSERTGSGSQTVGRIPWSRVIAYGSFYGLSGWLLSALWEYVSAMDSGYREFMRNEHERYTRMNKKKPKKAPEARYSR